MVVIANPWAIFFAPPSLSLSLTAHGDASKRVRLAATALGGLPHTGGAEAGADTQEGPVEKHRPLLSLG